MQNRLGLLALTAAITVTFLVLPSALLAPPASAPASTANLSTAAPPAALLKVNSTGIAGYEGGKSPNSTITYLNASWRQPTVTCTATNSSALFDALLAGNRSDLAAGTGVKCGGGLATTFAWYDFGVSNTTNVTIVSAATLPIPAGSVVHVSIHAGAPATVRISDGTHSISKTHASPGIDYVAQVGVLGYPATSGIQPLANFGTVSFGATYTHATGTNDMKIGTLTKGIGGFALAAKVTLRDTALKALAVPTPLVGSLGSFKIVWKAAT
ncbi:MAG: G1 family endopeptidase [Thermoplasmata archaeon]|nr:G1 family endopeptidase [Thermoplasmata archaeon]MCI4355800.1 G1 family endopeptidase [Thermoplasmata archaeon]